MKKLFKNINHSLTSKKSSSQVIEEDAAPSAPRPYEDTSPSSPGLDEDKSDITSSSEDEDDFIPNKNKPDADDIPEFEKSETKSSRGGQSFTQMSHIKISNCTGIQIGNQYHFNIQKPAPMKSSMTTDEIPSKCSKPQPPPPKIEKTFSNRDAAQPEDFISIKFDIGSNWREVAEKLGLGSGPIQQVYDKYKDKGTSEVFYQLMLKWKESQPRATTTIGLLCEALWNSNETSAATILSKLHPPK